MKHLLLMFSIPLLSLGQINTLQTFGTVSHFLISCPCKLLKYYDQGGLYYFCEDETLQTSYTIKEIKHKDGLGLLLNALNQNIYSQSTKNTDSLIIENKSSMISEYLEKNPKGVEITFSNYNAVIVNNGLEKKLFFSDNEFIASYEMIVHSKNQEITNQQFNNAKNSIRKKKLNFKKIF